jgi:hypothetical protein
VLYADSAGLDSESINLEALETLVSVSGMAVELLSVSRTATKRAPAEEPPAAVEAAPQPAYVPTSEYEPTPEPAPEPEPAFSGADTIQSYEAQPVESESFMESVAEEATTFTEDAPESSGVLGEEPAAWAPPVEAPATPRRRFGQDAELPVEVAGDEERRLHNDARRFARLLISEIKLYNEQKVAEGRMEHDLYDRLREYIDRSREMYDKRVKAEVAARYDYFHGELVNTLAEGDVSKLGSNYPGATVNA